MKGTEAFPSSFFKILGLKMNVETPLKKIEILLAGIIRQSENFSGGNKNITCK